jgi:hypothetical protein
MPLPFSFICAALLWTATAADPTPTESSAAKTPAGRTGMFRGLYEAPKNPAHQEVYALLVKAQLLEKFSESFRALKLPKMLVIKFAGCDGTSNAWYEPTDGTVTFCYEYVADLKTGATGAVAHGIPAELALEGATGFVLLHETSHAIFDLLKVPVLGREEDAADQVAAFTLLSAGEGIARRVLSGAAWMYLHDSKGRMPDDSDFADVHGLDAQRYYNVLCMAYGSNPNSFKGLVEKKYLPKDRAETCADEFQQVAYAVKRLIGGNVDVQVWRKTKAAHKARWEGPRDGGS